MGVGFNAKNWEDLEEDTTEVVEKEDTTTETADEAVSETPTTNDGGTK